MEQSAFNALFKKPPAAATSATTPAAASNTPRSVKRQRPHSHKSQHLQTGSRFTECPLCGKSVHASLANSHVEWCVNDERGRDTSTSAPREVSWRGTRNSYIYSSLRESHLNRGRPARHSEQRGGSNERRGGADHPGTLCRSVERDHTEGVDIQVTAATVGGSDHSLPPGCSSNSNKAVGTWDHQHTTILVDVCGGVEDASNGLLSARDDAPSSPRADRTGEAVKPGKKRKESGSMQQGSGADVARAKSCSSSNSSNAFSRLMTASALSNFREEMFLWRHADGGLSWGWGPAGRPRPAPPTVDECKRWSCQVATKGPDGRRAGMCELWTNLPPATAPGGGESDLGSGDGASGAVSRVVLGPGGDDNAGVKAAFPHISMSRLSVPVLKSMLQKNVRRRRAEAAARCALELSIRSWKDAIRRVLVIMIEDSLLHPAAPLLAWLMAATSKGYRAPVCLMDAFLCTVYETAKCPVRDSTNSCRQRDASTGEALCFTDEAFPAPHPKELVAPVDVGIIGKSLARHEGSYEVEGTFGAEDDGKIFKEQRSAKEHADARAAIACCRRALLMRMAYGGLSFDQALLKASCLSWGERYEHLFSGKGNASGAACADDNTTSSYGLKSPLPPDPSGFPSAWRCGESVTPFAYMSDGASSALKWDSWGTFLFSSYGGCGMPTPLRKQLLAHLVGEGGVSSTEAPPSLNSEMLDVMVPVAQQPVQPNVGTGARVAVADSARVAAEQQVILGGPIVREQDAILSGIDFHCSNVLDEVLRSDTVRDKVLKAITGGNDVEGGGSAERSSGELHYAGKSIGEAVKQAMWRCSSGLNARTLQVAFSCENEDGAQSNQLSAVLKPIEGDEGPSSGVDARVWAAISSEVAGWTRRFARGKLARGALGPS